MKQLEKLLAGIEPLSLDERGQIVGGFVSVDLQQTSAGTIPNDYNALQCLCNSFQCGCSNFFQGGISCGSNVQCGCNTRNCPFQPGG